MRGGLGTCPGTEECAHGESRDRGAGRDGDSRRARARGERAHGRQGAEGGNDDVRIVFDGAGTAWVPELAKKDHKAHGLYAAVGDRIAGVCAYCAGAFGVKDAVIAQGVQLAGEYEGHPSVRRLVHEGFQVITF